MKRRTVRLIVLSVLPLLGLIAIAQARYGWSGPEEQPIDPAVPATDVPPEEASQPNPVDLRTQSETRYERAAESGDAPRDVPTVSASYPEGDATPDGDVASQTPPNPIGEIPEPRRLSDASEEIPNAEATAVSEEPTDVQNRSHVADLAPEASSPVAGAAAPAQPAPAEGTGLPGGQQLEGAQAPGLTVEKLAPREIQVGKECTFEVKIRNVGPVAAHHVVVRDEIPRKTQLVDTKPQARQTAPGQLEWELGTLNPGDETSVQMQLLPLDEGEVGSVATVLLETQASARSLVTRPQLALRLSGPRQVKVGERVTIKIQISNPGSGAATGVMMLEDVPEGVGHTAGKRLEFEVGTLAPGESRELDLILTAEKEGQIVNAITAQGDANLSVQGSVEFQIIAPQLQVAIEGPKRRFLDRQAVYSVAVTNPGTDIAKDIELAAFLPKGMKFVQASNLGHYEPSSHSVVWGLEELPANEEGRVELVAIPMEEGDHVLRAQGKAAQGLTDQDQQTITVQGLAAIMFEVVDLDDPIEVGAETTYEIRVVNQGSKAATNVQVSVTTPPNMKPLSASGPSQHTLEADRVAFAPLARLASKADTTYRVKVQALASGDQRVQVQVSTDDVDKPVTKEESTTVYADE